LIILWLSSNILDERALASNVNAHQLRVDLDRETVEVGSQVLPGTEFVCSAEPAAWASTETGGNRALRELLVTAATSSPSPHPPPDLTVELV
jgi:hypothetical protein